jgi:hypothetical protein
MKNFTLSEIEQFVAKGYNSVSGRLCKSALFHLSMETQKAKALEKMHQGAIKHLRNGSIALIGANKLLNQKEHDIRRMTAEIEKLNELLETSKY